MGATLVSPHPLEWANPNISADIAIRTRTDLLIPNPPRSTLHGLSRRDANAMTAMGIPIGTRREMTSSQTAASAKSSRASGSVPAAMPSGTVIDSPKAAMIRDRAMSITSVAPKTAPTAYRSERATASDACSESERTDLHVRHATTASDPSTAAAMSSHAIFNAVPSIVVSTTRCGTSPRTFIEWPSHQFQTDPKPAIRNPASMARTIPASSAVATLIFEATDAGARRTESHPGPSGLPQVPQKRAPSARYAAQSGHVASCCIPSPSRAICGSVRIHDYKTASEEASGGAKERGDAVRPFRLDDREQALPVEGRVADLGHDMPLSGLRHLPVAFDGADIGVPFLRERLRAVGDESLLEALLGQAVLPGEVPGGDNVAVHLGELLLVHVQRDQSPPGEVDDLAHGGRREHGIRPGQTGHQLGVHEV